MFSPTFLTMDYKWTDFIVDFSLHVMAIFIRCTEADKYTIMQQICTPEYYTGRLPSIDFLQEFNPRVLCL